MDLNIPTYAPPPAPRPFDPTTYDNGYTKAFLNDLFSLAPTYMTEETVPVIFCDESRLPHCGRDMSPTSSGELRNAIPHMRRWATSLGLKVRGHLEQGWVFGLLVDNPYRRHVRPDALFARLLAEQRAAVLATVKEKIESWIDYMSRYHSRLGNYWTASLHAPFLDDLKEAAQQVRTRGYRATIDHYSDDTGYVLYIHFPK